MCLYRISIRMICMKSKICLCVDTDLPFDALNKKTSRLMYIYIYTCTHTHTHTQPHYSLLSLIHMRIHIRTTPYYPHTHTHIQHAKCLHMGHAAHIWDNGYHSATTCNGGANTKWKSRAMEKAFRARAGVSGIIVSLRYVKAAKVEGTRDRIFEKAVSTHAAQTTSQRQYCTTIRSRGSTRQCCDVLHGFAAVLVLL